VSYLLDTTVVIDHVEGYRPAVELIARLFEMTSELYTCDVVTCEALSKGDAHAVLVKRTLLDALEYVALAPEGALWAGDRRREAVESGKRKPSTTDALIAALAQSLGATVVTRNAKDFAAFDIPVLDYGESAA
jgi:predicted nucleic acid-binding protein